MALLRRIMHMVQEAMLGGSGLKRYDSQYGNVRPASEDPYGDPADQMSSSRFGTGSMSSSGSMGGRFGNVKPASQDPYGDPADQMGPSRVSMGGGGFGNVKPASQDPYGDPADQMPRSRGSMGSNVDPAGDPGDRMGWRR